MCESSHSRAVTVLVGLAATLVLVCGTAAAQSNFIANPGFDKDLSGWTADEEIAGWSVVDANENPDSGSAVLTSVDGDPDSESYIVGLKQCLGLSSGSTYTVGGKIRTPPGQGSTAAEGFIFLFYYADSSCSGLDIGSESTDSIFQSAWKYVSTTFTVPTGVKSVSVLLMTRFLPGSTAQYDDVFVKKGVIPPPPEVNFSASPSNISLGQSSTLSWATTNATDVSINQGVGAVPLQGSVPVTPAATTTYMLTATGPGGTSIAKATVNVGPPPAPSITFAASPSTILVGSLSTLSWNVSNATSVSINNGIGTQQLDGSVSVSPQLTTTYTLTAVGPGGTKTASAKVTVLIPSPLVSFSADPATINPGGSSTLSWTTSNASSVSIDNGLGAQALVGSVSVSPAATTAYTLTATGSGGTTIAQVTVSVAQPTPTVSFSAAPLTITAGQSSTLSWTTSNATSVAIDNGVGTQPPNGSTTVSPTATTTYHLTATGPGGSVIAQVTVSVGTPAPAITFTASPPTINIGDTSALTWTTTGATTVSIDQGLGARPLSGTTTVSPPATTTYTLTATGAGGTVQMPVTVTVVIPSPAVTFLANPPSIVPGGTCTLTWKASNATSVTIDNGIGTQPAEGSATVSPQQTTTYTLTASGPGGTTTAGITVYVGSPPPSVSFSANPNSIVFGESSTLSWVTADADSVVIDGGIGPQPLSGSVTVSPPSTTRYTLSATGSGGTTTSQATVRVTSAPLPAITFTATPALIAPGSSATLTWSTLHATEVTIDNGLGSQPSSGSVVVAPSATTTYKLTATGPGGTATAQVTVTLAVATCTAPPAGLQIAYTGLTSGCTAGGGRCIPGETISFVSSASGYAFQTCDAFLWSFDDGTTSALKDVTRAFALPGNHDVRLTVTNPNGTASTTVRVNVSTGRPRAVKR